MADKAPLLMRIVANAVCVSHRAGKIIRDVMSQGDLGIVEKVIIFMLLDIVRERVQAVACCMNCLHLST